MAEIVRLDLRGVPCPKNTAQALIKIELLDEGDEMEILVDDGEPVQNMLAAFEVETGLRVLDKRRDGRGWSVFVRKEA